MILKKSHEKKKQQKNVKHNLKWEKIKKYIFKDDRKVFLFLQCKHENSPDLSDEVRCPSQENLLHLLYSLPAPFLSNTSAQPKSVPESFYNPRGNRELKVLLIGKNQIGGTDWNSQTEKKTKEETPTLFLKTRY